MYCENCNTKVEIIELAWLDKELIRVEGYKCKECGKEMIILVTDNIVRNNIFKEQELLEEIKSIKYTLNKHLHSKEADTNMCKKEIKVLQSKLQVLEDKYKSLKTSNNIRCNKLALWYVNSIQKGD